MNQHGRLVIGIDFDGCFSRDPKAFRAVVAAFWSGGHECILVTNRTREMRAEVDRVIDDLIPIVWAGGRAKREAARLRGWQVDVWIDDSPATVDGPTTYVGMSR